MAEVTDRRRMLALIALGGFGLMAWVLLPRIFGREGLAAQEQAPNHREFTVTARKYEFIPRRIEVIQDDLVKITLRSDDIPHSFTIDEYRISKRVAPRGTTVFEFRADRVGTFVFYCNLTTDEGCRAMRGELIVHPR